MAAVNKFNSFMPSMWQGKHALNNGVANLAGLSAYKYKVMLTDTAPVATNILFQDLIEIVNTGGYPIGGKATTATISLAANITPIFFSDVSFTAVGGSIGPFRYAVVYLDQNDANTFVATDKYLVGWLDNGAELTLSSSQAVLIDFDGTNGFYTYTS